MLFNLNTVTAICQLHLNKSVGGVVIEGALSFQEYFPFLHQRLYQQFKMT